MLTSSEIHRIEYFIQKNNGLRMICLYEQIFREAHILYSNGELYFFLNEDVDVSLPNVRKKYLQDIINLTEYLQAKQNVLFTLSPNKSKYIPYADGVFLVGNCKLPKNISGFLEQAKNSNICINPMYVC